MRVPATIAALVVCTIACGRPKPDGQNQPRKVEDPAEVEAAAPTERESSPSRKWTRTPSAMPETFAAFPRPDLAALEGVWLVDKALPSPGVAWVVEDQGSKLTTIDHHGRERIFGVTTTAAPPPERSRCPTSA